jgi:hypothetical protein
MDENQAALISAQMKHALDLIKGDLEMIQTKLDHQAEMNSHRLKELEIRCDDHETRLRTVSEGVTTFKVWTGLASGSAGLTALAALFKSFLGGF